jgi:hypothetical protein
MLIRLNVGQLQSVVKGMKDEQEVLVSVPDKTGVVKIAPADDARLVFMATRSKPGNSILGDPAIISHCIGVVGGFGWAKKATSASHTEA